MITKLLTIGVGVIAVLLVGFWLGTRFSDAPTVTTADSTESLGYHAGPFRFGVELEPAAPVIGENRLHVDVRNFEGKPASGVAIKAVAEMAAMGTMPAMRMPTALREVAPGVYEGSFNLPMAGAWSLRMTLKAPEKPERTVVFEMATGRAGLAPVSGLSGGSETGMEEAPPGTITVDSRRRQLIGVTTGIAEVRPLTRTLRVVGRVAADERRLTDVSLKYQVWIQELNADFVGALVERGDVLFSAYSPDLYAAQQEYLQSYKRDTASTLLAAAERRLRYWDVSEAFIRELEKRGTAVKYVPVRAPGSGTIVMKDVVEGSAQPAGKTLMRIADLSQVWIEAEVYEADLPLIEVGMPAAVSLPYLPNRLFEGTVDYIYPWLAGESRTGKLRLSLPNPDGVLKPDMFADVQLKVQLTESLVVPDSAVIFAGETRVVFEDLGDGRLAPRFVATGRQADGWIEIVKGLEPGDRVVTSGNFLIASESRLKSGLDQW